MSPTRGMPVVAMQSERSFVSQRLYVRTALMVAAFPFLPQNDTIKRPDLNEYHGPICCTLSYDVFAVEILKKFEESTDVHRFVISCSYLRFP